MPSPFSRLLSGTSRRSPTPPAQSAPATSPSPPQTRTIIPDDPSKLDHTLGTLASALAILKGASEMTHVPFLKGAANVALTLVETARTYRANQTGSAELAYHAVYLTAALCEDCPKQPSQNVSRAIKAFKKELEAIANNMNDLSSKKAWNPKALLGTKSYADKIKSYCDSLYMAYKKFLLSLGLDTNAVVSRIERQVLRVEGGLQSLKQDTTDIKKDTADIKQHTEEIRSALKEQKIGDSLPPVALPLKPEIFYGREEYVERVVDLVVNKPGARVAILGPGGMGKTSVALAVIQDPHIVNAFTEDNRHWVPCETATSPEFLVELLALTTKISKSSNDRLTDVVKALRTSNQRHIILLDNFETLVEIEGKRAESEGILRTIALPNVNILVTMRGAQPPSTQFRWSSPPLEVLSLNAARQTFLDICPNSQTDSRLDELLRALDCVPLAVNLMASVGSLGETPTELLGRWMEERTSLLHLAEDRLNSVNKSVRISLESTTMVSNPEAVRLLAILSMLPGGAQRDFIKEVAPSIKDLKSSLAILVRVSLAYRSPDNTVIHVLSPIRSYMLHHHNLAPPTREGVYKAYYAMAKRGNCFGKPEFVDTVQELSKEAANLESVLLDALQHGDRRAAIEASLQYSEHLYRTVPRITVISAAVAIVENSEYHSLHAKILQMRGELYSSLGRYNEAYSDTEMAQKLFEDIGSPLGVAQCLQRLGDIRYMQGRYDEARSDLQLARDQFQHIGSPLGVAQCLRSLGDIHFMQGRYDEARSDLQLARDQFQHIEEPLGLAQCLQSLGDIHYMQGRDDEARSDVQLALDQFQHIGEPLGVAQCLMNLGNIHRMQDRYDEARSDLQLARDQFQHIGEPLGAAQCLKSLGYIHLVQGRYDEARSHLEKARDQFQDIGNPLGVTQCQEKLDDILRQQRHDDQATSAIRNPAGISE